MIGSSRSWRTRIRPRRTPNITPISEPEKKPTSIRDMLIDTSAKISPLIIIGMAVRITSSGGGIRNGLNMKVDSNCQIKKARASDAADSRMPRYLPGLIDARSLLNEARRKSGAWGYPRLGVANVHHWSAVSIEIPITTAPLPALSGRHPAPTSSRFHERVAQPSDERDRADAENRR